jgi:predicted nucleic acid-binding protein
MRKILFDVNVVLDVLLDRQPHVTASAVVFGAAEKGIVQGLLAAHAVTTIHYLIRKEMSAAKARRIISAILGVFGVAPVDSAVIQEALRLSCPDFEDAVAAAAARLSGCDYIVTRDPRRFHGSAVRVLPPEAVVPLLRAG